MVARYAIGIDLGTTNSALAYVDRKEARGARTIRTFEVPQAVAPAEVRPRPLLPSFVYIPGEHELPPGAIALPWNEAPGFAVGELARAQGGRVPGRLVSSSKSWLCHDRVDRRAPILPWNAPPEVARISPVEAGARILGHFRDAWDAEIARGDAEKAFLAQDVVITVPASFDAVARQLTLEAANAIGLERPILLEEPQAALYACMAGAGAALEERLPPGSLVLVVDVGGGTSDFTLVATRAAAAGEESEAGVVFERTAVSDHLLLGGDNMDLALARYIAPRLAPALPEGEDLDAGGWAALRHACREAKEALLAEDGPERLTVTLAGAGTRLVGGARSAELTRADALVLVVEGFFPEVPLDDTTPRRSRTGLQEIGLPFVADPGVTRHLGEFLRRHAADASPSRARERGGESEVARPTHVLFNGGVVTNPIVRARVLDTIAGWTGERPRELPSESFDLAVAHGAAYYALIRRGEPGRRIRGGLGRAYYVGVDAGLARPAALCLVPRGMEAEKPVATRLDMKLQANVPVQFPFYFSSERHDPPGTLVREPRLAGETEEGEFHELPPLFTVIRAGTRRVSQRREVPVELVARLTEIGTLELACHATDGTDRSWKLELTVRTQARIEPVRGREAGTGGGAPAIDPGRIERCRAAIDAAFGAPAGPEGPLPGLARALEQALEQDRDAWPVEVCRRLWEAVFERREDRKRSPEHEARFWNLAAFCLRPGFGAVLDDHRVSQMWKLLLSGLSFPKADACRLERLIAERRMAGGLSRGQQEQIYLRLREDLLGRSKKRIPRQEWAEEWRLAASLEHLAAKRKEELGDALLALMARGEGPPRWGVWCVGRLGARLPRYGPVNEAVAPAAAARWIRRLLAILSDSVSPAAGAAGGADLEAGDRERAIFSIVQLGRRTGDPARDVPAAVSAEAAAALRALGSGEAALLPLLEVVEAAPPEQRLLFGDTVPAGLRLERVEA
jgi:hypothetical protein